MIFALFFCPLICAIFVEHQCLSLLFIRIGLHTFTFIIDGVINCEMVLLNSVQVSIALFQICERFLKSLFQMSAVFSKSYLDWMTKVSEGGWSVLTIATHPSQRKPSVMGPVEEMRGVLWRVFDAEDFNHVDQVWHIIVCLVLLLFAVDVFFNRLFQDTSQAVVKDGLITSPGHQEV